MNNNAWKSLERRRTDLGISFPAISERTGVSVPTLKRLFSPTATNPTLRNLQAVACVLGVELRIGTSMEVVLEQSVRIHHRTVQIHPFENGNGRWSRMLANIWLKRHGKRPIEWPEADPGNLASEVRTEYLTALKEAGQFNISPLTELHRRFWPNA